MATKTLSFSQNTDGKWVATESVSGSFAIHMERHASGSISIDMTSVEDTEPQNKHTEPGGESYDQEFACRFPKWLTISSSSMPISGKCFVVDDSEEASNEGE